jgi:hypothetical protein
MSHAIGEAMEGVKFKVEDARLPKTGSPVAKGHVKPKKPLAE